MRIVAGDLTRQTAPDGTVSVFGTVHSGLTLDLTPALSAAAARGAIAQASGGEMTPSAAELVVLPLADGYHLAYRGQAIAGLEIANSARLNGFPYSEAGALNEAFSDMFGIATAFYFQPAGNGPMQACYLQSKDLTVPSGAFGRGCVPCRATRRR